MPRLGALLSAPSAIVQQQAAVVLLPVSEAAEGQGALCDADVAEALVALAIGAGSATKRAATGIVCQLAKRKDYVPALIRAGAARAHGAPTRAETLKVAKPVTGPAAYTYQRRPGSSAHAARLT